MAKPPAAAALALGVAEYVGNVDGATAQCRAKFRRRWQVAGFRRVSRLGLRPWSA
jgi:hypothetical protein